MTPLTGSARRAASPIASLLLGCAVVAACTSGADDETRRTSARFRPTVEEVECPKGVAGDIPYEVSCGYVTVLENRSSPKGNRIRIFVTRIQPPGGDPAPDPMFLPGTNVSEIPAYAGIAPMAERVNREVIIMDQRGLGHSEPNLACPEVKRLGRESFGVVLGSPAMEILSLDAVGACRDRLMSRGIDLGSYNLAETAADAEDIRIALGIEEWNLITLGTASSISFEIMRRFPEHIRAVVFDSPRPYQVDLFMEVVLGTKRAFAEVVRACAKDPTCNRFFPDLGSMLTEALRRLYDDPSLITEQGEDLRILVDDATAVRVLSAGLTLSPDFVAVFPLAVEMLRQHGWVDADPAGDWVTWYDDPIQMHGIGAGLTRRSHGLFYSVLCHDEVPFVDRDALARAAGGASWYIGANLQSPFFQVCAEWDAGIAEVDPHDPITSDIPTLMLVGRFDPLAPLPLVEESAERLSRNWIVEFPNGTHNVLSHSDCALEMRNTWIDDPTVPPDTSCVADMPDIEFRSAESAA